MLLYFYQQIFDKFVWFWNVIPACKYYLSMKHFFKKNLTYLKVLHSQMPKASFQLMLILKDFLQKAVLSFCPYNFAQPGLECSDFKCSPKKADFKIKKKVTSFFLKASWKWKNLN